MICSSLTVGDMWQWKQDFIALRWRGGSNACTRVHAQTHRACNSLPGTAIGTGGFSDK